MRQDLRNRLRITFRFSLLSLVAVLPALVAGCGLETDKSPAGTAAAPGSLSQPDGLRSYTGLSTSSANPATFGTWRSSAPLAASPRYIHRAGAHSRAPEDAVPSLRLPAAEAAVAQSSTPVAGKPLDPVPALVLAVLVLTLLALLVKVSRRGFDDSV